jgi:hypothetical protein
MVLETADRFRSMADLKAHYDTLEAIARHTAKALAEADVAEAQRVRAAKARIARGVGKLEDFQLVQADRERQLDDDADSRARR